MQDSAGAMYTGELEIRVEEGLAIAAGRALTLSVREFDLLVALAARSGAITRREDLYKQVWGSDLRSGDRSVDVYVSKLRSKLARAMPDRRFIHTHPGFGYRFQPQPTSEPARMLPSPSPPSSSSPPSPATPPALTAVASTPSRAAATELSRDVHNGGSSRRETDLVSSRHGGYPHAGQT